MKMVMGDGLWIHRKQRGVAPIVIIAVALLVLLILTAILTIRGLKNPQSSSSPAGKTGNTKAGQNCTSTDFGGCDSEKNFYQWKDDGLRK